MFTLLQYCFTIIISIYLSGIWTVGKAQIYGQNHHSKLLLLFKLISLNNKINSSYPDTLRIAILQDEDMADSTITEIELTKIAFSEFRQANLIQRKHFKVFSLPGESLLQLSNDFPQILLINSESDSNLNNILQFCSSNSILSFTFDSTFVSRGVSVGLCSDHKDHIKILINWDQLNAEGGGFDAQILQLAKIYRQTDE